MQRHDKTIAMLKESPLELDTIVARHRQDFTGDFFQHLHLRIEACRNDAEKREGATYNFHGCHIFLFRVS